MKHLNKFGKRRADGARTSIGRARASSTDVFESALYGELDSTRPRFDPPNPGADRKTLQLCRQVERALALGLAGQSDELLRDLQVDGVQPMGSAGHLLVRVIVPNDVGVLEVMARLEKATPALRKDVASAICRKRVPALSFMPIAERSEVPHD